MSSATCTQIVSDGRESPERPRHTNAALTSTESEPDGGAYDERLRGGGPQQRPRQGRGKGRGAAQREEHLEGHVDTLGG